MFIKTGTSETVNHLHLCNGDSSSHVEVSVYPIINEMGDIDKFVHISKDITARMRREEEIRNLNVILEQKIKEEVSLREQERQLLLQQTKLAAMGEMIGAIAHQWKQPLNVISLTAQGMEDAYEHDEMTKEYIKSTVSTILNQIDFMSKTINDFRNFLKPSKVSTDFNVKEVIEDVLFMFAEMLSKSDIIVTLENDNNSDKFIATGQPNEFKHVVLNLINNSSDAIRSLWEKKILSRDVQGKININLSNDDGKVLVTISDNGGGIAEEIIDKIFDPYFTSKSDDKGTGVGLYISKTIVESMGGSILCKNTDDGAEFRIKV
jgi:signal transduction histidine kinase